MKRLLQGFTLIEMLVVLIIVALVSGVLFQALERSYALQRRFGTELFKVQQGQMAADWYRQTVQGLYPDQREAANIFRGDAYGFSGLSTNPLGPDIGAPTPISWKLVSAPDKSTTEFVYTERGNETTILSWRGADAKLVYVDAERVPHNQWPPPLGLFPQLPRQIMLEIKDNTERIAIVASPMGPTEPPIRPQDVFNIVP